MGLGWEGYCSIISQALIGAGRRARDVRRGTAGRVPRLADGLLHRARTFSTIDALLDLLTINPNDVALEEGSISGLGHLCFALLCGDKASSS